jgi:hypothetical protein
MGAGNSLFAFHRAPGGTPGIEKRQRSALYFDIWVFEQN